MTAEKGAELGLEAGIGCIEHFAAGHDNHVDTLDRLVMAKKLPDEPFCAISFNGLPHLAGGGNTETGGSGLPVPRKHRHQAARTLEPRLIDELKISPFPHVFRP